MLITEIDWDVTMDEVLDYFYHFSLERKSDILNIPIEKIKEMNNNLIIDIAEEKFHHNPGLIDEIFDLPNKLEIDNMEEDLIADYLSDKYGFCVNGFCIN